MTDDTDRPEEDEFLGVGLPPLEGTEPPTLAMLKKALTAASELEAAAEIIAEARKDMAEVIVLGSWLLDSAEMFEDLATKARAGGRRIAALFAEALEGALATGEPPTQDELEPVRTQVQDMQTRQTSELWPLVSLQPHVDIFAGCLHSIAAAEQDISWLHTISRRGSQISQRADLLSAALGRIATAVDGNSQVLALLEEFRVTGNIEAVWNQARELSDRLGRDPS